MSKFCAKCGANIAPNAGFCPLCGFAANAKLPLAPQKNASQPKVSAPSPAPAPVPQPQKQKKSPFGLIAAVIAAVSTIVAVILLILLLLPDNNCDICGKKAKTEKSPNEAIEWCEECNGKCTLCGKSGKEFGELASGQNVYLCYECDNYIEENKVVDITEPVESETEEITAGNFFVNIPEETKKPITPSFNEETTKQNNISGGDHSGSEPSTATTKATESTSQNNAGTNDKTAKSDKPTIKKSTIDADGCKLTPVDLLDNKATFIINEVDPEFKEEIVYLEYTAFDEKGNKIVSNTIRIEFDGQVKKGNKYTSSTLHIPANAASIDFNPSAKSE